MAKISILFHEGRDFFFPGETIQGSVNILIESKSIVKCKRLLLEFKGVSKVNWDETRDGERRTIEFREEAIYLNNPINLTSSLSMSAIGVVVRMSEGIQLFPGKQYEVPFSFWLPSGLPGSAEEKYGYVKYSAKATLERNFSFQSLFQTAAVRQFSVIGILDLNNFHVSRPSGVEDERNLCCLWCKSGPILTRITLEKTGFMAGENICAHIEFENQSGNPIKDAKLTLVKAVTFRARGVTKHDKDSIKIVNITSQIRDCILTEFEVNLEVPPTPTSGTQGTLMDIQYYVVLKVNPKGLHKKINLQLPIKIGTIPLNDNSAHNCSSSPTLYQVPAQPNQRFANQMFVQVHAQPGHAFAPLGPIFAPHGRSLSGQEFGAPMQVGEEAEELTNRNRNIGQNVSSDDPPAYNAIFHN